MAKTQQNLTPAEQLQQKFKSSRANLLLVIILTIVNIVLFFFGSETMLLFSISVPYYAVILASVFEIPQVLVIGCVIAAVVLVLYFLCWLLSKKHPGWLIAALVLFIIDTLVLAWLYISISEFSGIVDVVFHIWILYYLVIGIRSSRKLKDLPPEEMEPVETEVLPDYSSPLRMADEDVKCRILLETEYGGHRICYRRVKRVNELIIDGQVYDEYEALVELPHTLTARIAGHTYEVGCSENSRTFFNVDGEQIESKIRLV